MEAEDVSMDAGAPDLQSQVDTLNAQLLEGEASLHDATNRIQELEAALQSSQSRDSQEQTLQESVRRLEAELHAKERVVEAGAGVSRRVEEVEKEKRDLLGLVERLQGDKSELEASLQSLRTTHNGTLASIRQIEGSQAQSADQERSARLKLQASEGELEILRRDRDWHKQELERVERDASAARDERHSQVTRLQSALEAAETLASSSAASLEALRASHTNNETRLSDALARVAELQSRLAEQDASFKSEMESQKRLVELMERREEASSARVEEIERDWAEQQALVESRDAEFEAELNTARARADALQNELDQLRAQGDDPARETDIFAPRSRAGTPSILPGSPGGAGNSFVLSPSASIASRFQKGGRSHTEVYADYVRIQEELAAEKAETKRLSDSLVSVLSDIEERAPLLREQRLEFERISAENNTLAAQLARALEERDINERRANGLRLDAEAAQRETVVLNGQLNDLKRQIEALTRSIAQFEDPSIAGRSGMDTDEEVELPEADVLPAELITFSTVSQLIQNNHTLLKATRELSAQMDQNDEDAIRRLERSENEAVKEAHDTILALKDELERQRTLLEAGSREREMLRRLVSNRAPSGVHAAPNGAINGSFGTDERLTRELADLQMVYEAYKTETIANTQRHSEESRQLREQATQAAIGQAKAKVQVDHLNEQLQLQKDHEKQQKTEIDQLSKTIASLKKTSAQQEQQVYERGQNVITLTGDLSKAQHELSNLRAEREIWKSQEARLLADNELLGGERTRLNDLLRTLQSMQNELESSGSAAKKRLEDDVARYSQELTTLRERLATEEEAYKRLSLSREVDQKSLQDRLDKLTAEHSNTREELLTAKHSLETLQQKYEETARSLSATEAKLAVYTTPSGGNGANGLTAEQQLQIELAELKGELQAAKVEAEQGRAHVEQFKAVAAAAEAALADFQSTYDEDKAANETASTEREAALTSANEQNAVLAAEISSLNDTNNALYRQVEEARSASSNEVKQLQQQIEDMQSSHSQRQTEHGTMRESLLAAEKRAAEAHDRYQQSVGMHGQSIEELNTLKAQLAESRSAALANETAASTATANLESATESWNRQRTALQRDLDETRDRLDAALGQNKILHEQLEQVIATAGKVKQAGEGLDATEESVSDQSQQIVSYLRREQEILSSQLQLERQGASRLRSKLEYTERSLDEVRGQLTAEREQHRDNAAAAQQQAELLDKVNQVNLLRESNTTLRDESERNAKKVASLEARVREIGERDLAQRQKVLELEAEIETRNAAIKSVEENAARWKARSDALLQKYERIDPAEFQALKDENAALQAQRVELEEKVAAAATLQNELDRQTADTNAQTQLVAEGAEEQERLRAEAEKFRNNFRSIQKTAKDQRDTINGLNKDIEELKEQIKTLTPAEGAEQARADELTAAKSEAEEAKKTLATRETELTSLRSELEAAKKVVPAAADDSESKAELACMRDQLEQARRAANEAQQSIATFEKTTAELRTELATAREQLETAQSTTVTSQVPVDVLASAAEGDLAGLTEEQRAERVAAAQTRITEEREQAVAAAVAALQTRLDQERVAALESAASAARAEADQRVGEVTTRLSALQAESASKAEAVAQEHNKALQAQVAQAQKAAQEAKAQAQKDLKAAIERTKKQADEEVAKVKVEAEEKVKAEPVPEIVPSGRSEEEFTKLEAEVKRLQGEVTQREGKNKLLQQQLEKARNSSKSDKPATPTAKAAPPAALPAIQQPKPKTAPAQAASTLMSPAGAASPTASTSAAPADQISIFGRATKPDTAAPAAPANAPTNASPTGAATRPRRQMGPGAVLGQAMAGIGGAAHGATGGKRPHAGESDGEQGDAKRPKGGQ